MRKFLKWLFLMLVFLSLISIGWRLGGVYVLKTLGLDGRAGVKIETNKTAKVIIDGVSVGQTPFQSDKLVPGVSLVELVGVENGSDFWSGRVSLNDGTVTVVNRELAPSIASSSGEVINLQTGSGAQIVSFPEGANVAVDGVGMGKTPILLDIKAGEHLFELSKIGYLSRSVKVSIPEGQRLLMSVDMSLSSE